MVSLVMPARNEAASLESALRSKLRCTYPNLELVLVDDRSTDETGQIADALAQEEPRLRVVHLRELPPGWLGKVHAMQRGLEATMGEWILFSDADVHLDPTLLERVVAYAEAEAADHIALLPTMRSGRGLLEATLATVFRLLMVVMRLWGVSDARSSAAVGVGAFNLVRRSALVRTPGLDWLKMEIGDDVALGLMLKRAGARLRAINGVEDASVLFYPSFWAMARSLEKNGASFPFWGIVAVVLLVTGFELSPLFALAGPGGLRLAGLALLLLAAGVTFAFTRWFREPAWPALVPWLGILPLALVMLRSALLAQLRDGVAWRGTFYSRAEVRAGGRLR
jgi:glycosyltransferase involved in cell wall biosynthesis